MFRIMLAAAALAAPATAAQAQKSGIDKLTAVTQNKTQDADEEALGEDGEEASPADRVGAQAQRQAMDRARLGRTLTVKCRDDAAIRAELDRARSLLEAARGQDGAALKASIARARAHLGTALAATGCPRGSTAVGKRTDDAAYGIISKL